MTTIRLISEEEASPEVHEVYEDVKDHFNLDFVPNIIKAMANNPATLRQQWETMKQAESAWGAETFYLLSLVSDVVNGCDYCAHFDAAMLKQAGWDDAKIEGLTNFIANAVMWNTYVKGLGLEPDVTPEKIERRMAA